MGNFSGTFVSYVVSGIAVFALLMLLGKSFVIAGWVRALLQPGGVLLSEVYLAAKIKALRRAIEWSEVLSNWLMAMWLSSSNSRYIMRGQLSSAEMALRGE